MTVEEQAEKYLDAIPSSVSGAGGHDQTMVAARALVWGFLLPQNVAARLLDKYNLRCQPPWSRRELSHKLEQANKGDFDKPRGWLLNAKQRHFQTRVSSMPQDGQKVVSTTTVKPKQYDTENAKLSDIPPPMPDPLPLVLQHCFQPGEGIRIMQGIVEGSEFGPDPNGGLVLTREEWLQKMDGGKDINNYYTPSIAGMYIGVNPIKSRAQNGKMQDKDVTAYRHVLLEFDKIDVPAQWQLYQQSKVPIAAVIFSANKSLHAWVKIQAKDWAEYRERVEMVYAHFSHYQPDRKNRNPARLSRCPGGLRGDVPQSLHAIDIGAPSFAAWAKDLLVEGIGTTYTTDIIEAYTPKEDGRTLIGDDWLRKGGSASLYGPSGVGKSSLVYQMCVCWAVGLPCFGITPKRPLKILLLEAENDIADLHKHHVGIVSGMQLVDDQREMLRQNLIVNHCVTHTGPKFITAMQRLIERHEPVLTALDPLLSFIGDDISKQTVCSEFLRNQLNPIAEATGVGWFAVHHTGKPVQERYKGKKVSIEKTLSEWSYQAMGSSELTNWSRAIMVLHEKSPGKFNLVLAKRGKQAGATHPNGALTDTLHLQHHSQMIYWEQRTFEEQATGPDTEKNATGTSPKTVSQKIAFANVHDFLHECPKEGELQKDIVLRMNLYAANKLALETSEKTCRDALGLCIGSGKLAKRLVPAPNGKRGRPKKEIRYFKGPNA